MAAFFSSLTVASVGLTCKSFLNLGFCSIQVNGLNILLDALNHPERRNDRGLVTERVFSSFFRLGQTLETFRGQGIYQESVNTAIQKLNEGSWVHLFGEGKVNQPDSYTIDPEGYAHIPRFKWGVGRIVMESSNLPVVIPMWLSGYDKLMPEGRPFPRKYLPRLGVRLSVTFGEPIPPELLSQAINHSAPDDKGAPSIDAQRSRLTALIHNHVESLGRTVCGPLLQMKQ
ncbi:tafazzin-PC [Coprinopsis cinerea okayama7|uniref:Tafazzin family protein n=1 Tax=Coprinopsis cinerea (strain Okayama-7 / 130 / ATCC MYA-4618 / FGSC 9003) TaxID=240176 RepID=A8NYD4_COPC7|nr:tafazzin-PC [Coprinopsis cinerea okayama7\|eukprot:XP_001837400.2 tafazzin-PC [Coprinopsis cinerea okayama7\